jgi:competence ComEA-like helix-hairpin-helix protein
MSSKQWIKDYFTYTKKDRIFIIAVTTVIGGSLVVPHLFSPRPAPLVLQQNSALVLAMDTLQQREARKPSYKREESRSAYQYERSVSSGFSEHELFPFDPNTITAEDWQRLGLNARTSKTIVNYTLKGGKFYKPEDLQKIWGMPEGFYDRVKDYVRITAVRKEYVKFNDTKSEFTREDRKPTLIAVNGADTAVLIALPGIGSKLAARIINFREKLGGFYSVDQIGETYGLPDSTFQKIKGRLQIDASSIRKIAINTATIEELKAHPYIKWHVANAIVEYRNQHGPFKNVEELKNIVLIDDVLFEKIVSYLDL